MAALDRGSFAAIDFETATFDRASACALGVVLVEDGQVSGVRDWLIKPPGNAFHSFHTGLHGIGPEATEDAAGFMDVFAEACAFIGRLPVLAHYAPFDLGVVRAECARAGEPPPSFTVGCTVVLARRTWPGLASYSLPFVARFLGADGFMHHDAADDARACAEVARGILVETTADDIEGAARAIGVRLGKLQPGAYHPCLASGSPSSWNLMEPRPCDVNPEHPFADADVAFTGTLLSMPRRQAAQLVVSAGGRFTQSVSKNTEFLVFGEQDFWKFADGEKSAKTHQAEAVIAGGYPLQVLGEADFLRMIG